MKWVFFTLLAAHAAASWAQQQRRKDSAPLRPNVLHLLVQFALFCCACYYGIQFGVFTRQLLSPLYIAAGAAAGHVIFGLSLMATHGKLSDAIQHFFDLASLWEFTVSSPAVLSRFFSVAFAEELIYRVVAQPLLIALALSLNAPPLAAAAIGIAVTAALFALMHHHFFTNSFWVSVEFLAFAILLGLVYHFTASFIFVIVIHALRDIEIAYLEYLSKLDELGDKDAAVQAVEKAFFRMHSVEHS